ncbi:hypothetical protein OF846_003225 [Rhodotorula toruloides]|nr:hypothetical protein OF846_003225 [Rhodotorula toruloides]
MERGERVASRAREGRAHDETVLSRHVSHSGLSLSLSSRCERVVDECSSTTVNSPFVDRVHLTQHRRAPPRHTQHTLQHVQARLLRERELPQEDLVGLRQPHRLGYEQRPREREVPLRASQPARAWRRARGRQEVNYAVPKQ